jgi:hypothetical protein
VVVVVRPVPVMVIDDGAPEDEYAVVIDVTTGAAANAAPVPASANAVATINFPNG